MQAYDVALKLLLQGAATLTMRELSGTAVARWLDVELPKVQNLRLDLLGETVDGGLVHVELHSSDHPAMPLRMAEYCLGVFRLFGRSPRQVVLYAGEPLLRMDSGLQGPGMLFQYRLIDIRTLDGDRLLESEEVGDNSIAILARLRDHERAVHRIRRADCRPADGGKRNRPGAVDDWWNRRHGKCRLMSIFGNLRSWDLCFNKSVRRGGRKAN